MTYPQFLAQSNDTLIQAKPSFKTNGQEVQSIRQAQPDLLPPLVRNPVQPKIWRKKSETHRHHEIHDGIAAPEHCSQETKSCRNSQTQPQENVGVSRFAIAREHQSSHQLRGWFGSKQAANDRKRLCEILNIESRLPSGRSACTHRSRHF